MSEVETHSPLDCKKILLGNKNDLLSKRQVSQEQGKKFAEQYGMFFMEVSAKSNENNCVEDAIDNLIEQIMHGLDEKAILERKTDNQFRIQATQQTRESLTNY